MQRAQRRRPLVHERSQALSRSSGPRLPVGVGVALVAALVAGCRCSGSGDRANAQAGREAGTSAPLVGDWFALGSGCRARLSEPGDVTLEPPSETGGPGRKVLRFRLPRFELDVRNLAESAQPLARECAVRVALQPPPTLRIAALRARTRVVASKAAGPKLELSAALRLGATRLGESNHALEEALHEREFNFNFDTKAPPPLAGCGEPHVLGYDFTWIANRLRPEEGIRVSLGGERMLELEVDLSECGEGGTTQ